MSPSIKVPNKSDTWWLIIFCVWSNMDLIMKRGKKNRCKSSKKIFGLIHQQLLGINRVKHPPWTTRKTRGGRVTMKDAAETSYRAAVFKRDNQACFLDHTNRQKQNCLYIHASAKNKLWWQSWIVPTGVEYSGDMGGWSGPGLLRMCSLGQVVVDNSSSESPFRFLSFISKSSVS